MSLFLTCFLLFHLINLKFREYHSFWHTRRLNTSVLPLNTSLKGRLENDDGFGCRFYSKYQ